MHVVWRRLNIVDHSIERYLSWSSSCAMTPRAPNANPKANTEKPSITNALLTYAIALPSLEHSLLKW